jgi:hypothetical protein
MRLLDTDFRLRDLIHDIDQGKKSVKEYLNSDSREGAAFRDYVQIQALERAIAYQEMQPEVNAAVRHAQEIQEPWASSEDGKKVATQNATRASTEAKEGIPAKGGTTPQTKPETPSTPSIGPLGGHPDVTLGGPGQFELSKGPQRISGSSQNLSAELIRKGMVNKEVEGKPTYTGYNKEEQETKAADFAANSPDQAKMVATGKMVSPSDIRPEFVFKAVKSLANQTRDVTLQTELARSPINKEMSLHGQALGAWAGVYDDFDPVGIIHDIEYARAKAQGVEDFNHMKETIVQDGRESIKQLTQDDWLRVLKSIQCDY